MTGKLTISMAVLLWLFASSAAVLAQNTSSSSAKSQTETSPFDGAVFYCTECMTEVPEHIGAGDACPQCGAFFKSATNADGSESIADLPRDGISFRVWCGLGLVLIFATEYGVRRWRKRRRAPDL